MCAKWQSIQFVGQVEEFWRKPKSISGVADGCLRRLHHAIFRARYGGRINANLLGQLPLIDSAILPRQTQQLSVQRMGHDTSARVFLVVSTRGNLENIVRP